jgi:glycosyltransferase involved in cell wall biosynthesis
MKILYISPWFPYPPVNGSKIRIFNLLKALAKKHEIILLAFIRPGEVVDSEGLSGLCRQVETVFTRDFQPRTIKSFAGYFSPKPRHMVDTFNREMKDKVAEKYQEFQPDHVVFSQFGTVMYRPKNSEIPCCLEELEVSVLLDQVAQPSKMLRRFRTGLMWRKSSSYIKQSVPNFTFCTTVSEAEERKIKELVPHYDPLYVIPNGVDINYFKPVTLDVQPNSLIYTGSLTYSANFDAIEFFLSEIFPIVRAHVPETRLRITGSYQNVPLKRLNLDDHIELTGYKPDIRPLMASTSLCIVPLRIGGGTRLKILEAMSMGIPVISTSKGAEGLAVTPGKDIIIADNPDNFATKIIQLFNDTNFRTRLSINGRKLVESSYAWETIGQEFNSLIEKTSRWQG